MLLEKYGAALSFGGPPLSSQALVAMGLDAVELIIEAEKHFDVSVPDEQLERAATVGQFAQLLFELRSAKGLPLPYEVVLLELQQMISKMFRIPMNRIGPEAHFINDLGLSQ